MRVWEEFYREGGGGYAILCMERILLGRDEVCHQHVWEAIALMPERVPDAGVTARRRSECPMLE